MLAVPLARSGLLVHHVEHQRHAGTVDIGVDEAHAQSARGEAGSEVGGDGALAHAALAAGYGYDVLHVGQHLAHAGALATEGRHLHPHIDLLAQRLLEVEDHRLLHALAAVHGGIAHLNAHMDGTAFDADIAHQPKGHDVLLQVGLNDAR